MKNYLQWIDRHTTGGRCDVTPLFADQQAFSQVLHDLALPFRNEKIDLVAGLDALGFILGAGLAVQLGAGFLAIRKRDKLPVPVIERVFVDYSGIEKGLTLRADIDLAGMRILLTDEWIETAAQMNAALDLIQARGGNVIGVAALHMDDTPGVRQLLARVRCHALESDVTFS